MSSKELPLLEFTTHVSPEIAYIRSLKPGSSGYLFIGARVLEIICMYRFATNAEIFSKIDGKKLCS